MEDQRPSVLKPALDPALEMSDADMFWQDHWKKFVWGLVALVTLILAAGLWSFYRGHVRSSAEALYSEASSPEAWQSVIGKFPGSVSAGDARLRLAASLRAEGKLDEAAAELDAMVTAQPDHPLAGAAWYFLGEIRQFQGNIEAALEAYRESSSRYKDSYAAPLALLAEAKVLLSRGAQGEAKAILESIGVLYPETPAAMIASGEISRLAPPVVPAATPGAVQ